MPEYETVASAAAGAPPLTLACWYRPLGTSAAVDSWVMTIATTAVGINEVTIRWDPPNQVVAYSTDGLTFPEARLTIQWACPGRWIPMMGVFASYASRVMYVGNASASDSTSVTSLGTLASTYIGTGFQLGSGVLPNNGCEGQVAFPAVWTAALGVTEAVQFAQGADPLTIRPAVLAAAWDDFGRDRVGSAHMTTLLGRPVSTKIVHHNADGLRPVRSYGPRRVLRAG